MTNQVTTYLKYANVQMATEALFELQTAAPGRIFSGAITDLAVLTDGNKRSSRFTTPQATEFKDDWTVVEHISNTKTGFSGTLFKCLRDDEARGLKAGELVMSLRSTEFIDDAVRDSKTNELEIKEFGWAFGQIADMMEWYDKLDKAPDGISGKNITVTGYSLGGHLATAFNRVMVARGQGSRVDNTYTFNGAGVGEIQTGHGMLEVLNEFNAAKVDGANLGYFTDSVAKKLYGDAKALLDKVAPTTAQIVQVKTWIDAAISATPPLTPAAMTRLGQLVQLQKAIARVDDINKEADRVAAGITSGGAGLPALPTDKANIAQLQLDYQLAVGRASQFTSGYNSGIAASTYKAVTARASTSLPGASPIHDIYGAPLPSLVANSQLHYGQGVPVYIEDQPLHRGTYLGDVIENSSLLRGEVKLLNSGFAKNDFGDTHSLVLLVDSLSVQAVLAQLDPDVQPATLNTLLQNASNKWRVTDADQGKAEADVLENVVNGLGKMFVPGWTDLQANPSGGTWAEIGDSASPSGSFSGRETLHTKLAAISQAINNKGLAGKVKVTPSNVDGGALAREDFAALLSLQSLSPVLLTAKDAAERMWLSDQLKPGNDTAHTAWKADKDMSYEDREAGKRTYSDAFLRSRAEMLNWKMQFNEKNVAFDATFGVMSTQSFQRSPSTVKDAALPIDSDYVYKDNKTSLTLNIDGNGSAKRYITFGAATAETLAGGQLNDRLFGGAGNDTLQGQDGRDYLEGNEGIDRLQGGSGQDTLLGGAGNDAELNGGLDEDLLMGGAGIDTYVLEAGTGADQILDVDGKIELRSGSVPSTTATAYAGILNGGNKLGDNTWTSADNKVSYQWTPDETGTGKLKIKAEGHADVYTVLNFKNNDLGIDLKGDPVVTPGTVAVGGRDITIAPYLDPAKDLGQIKPAVSTPAPGGGVIVTYADSIANPNANDHIEGTWDDYWIYSNDQRTAQDGPKDVLKGEAGNDLLEGLNGADLLDGGIGDDLLIGGEGADTLLGGDGQDYILGSVRWGPTGTLDLSGYNNIIKASDPVTRAEDVGLPSSAIARSSGFGWTAFDVDGHIVIASKTPRGGWIIGEKNPLWSLDTMQRDLGRQFADGRVSTVVSEVRSATTATLVPIEVVDWMDRGNVIDAGEGNDYVLAGVSNDQVEAGSGADTVMGLKGDDAIDGGADNDTLYGDGWQYDDVVHTSTLGTTIEKNPRFDHARWEHHGKDTVDGGSGNDLLLGQGNDDNLRGGEGDDNIYGDDRMYAEGVAAEMYRLPTAYLGNDYLDGGAGKDTLVGGGRDDDLFGGQGDDLLFGDDDIANLKAEHHGKDYLDGGEGNDTLEGAAQNDTLMGGDGNDDLWGDASIVPLKTGEYGHDQLDGGLGDDFLNGGGQADTLQGGDGNDLLQGDGSLTEEADHGADLLMGGAGNDELQGDGGNDTLQGGSGTDLLKGGKGNDLLQGGEGADILEGGEGDDRYILDASDTARQADNTVDSIQDIQGNNTIEFQAATPGNLVVFKSSTTPGAMNIVAGDSGLLMLNGAAGINNQFILANGEQLSTHQLVGRYGVSNDAEGSASPGGAAFTATGASGEHYALGGRGNDEVGASAWGNHATLSGGRGDDKILGRHGGNTYLYELGDGDDVITDGSVRSGALTAAGASQIVFGQGITAADISLSVEQARAATPYSAATYRLVVNIAGKPALTTPATPAVPAGRIAIEGYESFDFNNPSAALPVGLLKFDGGSQVTVASLLAAGVNTNGTASSEGIYGIWHAETLSGGAGDDTLSGAGGADTYRWGLGDGKDRIIETGPAAQIDTLQFTGSLKATDLKFHRKGNDLTVVSNTTADELLVSGQFAGDGQSQGVDKLVFAGGATWSRADLLANLVSQPPLLLTRGDDFYTGTADDEKVWALGGNDTLKGQAGNDTLDGGTGNDSLYGGDGSDVYAFGRGSGHDYVVNLDNDAVGLQADTILLAPGIAPADVTVRVTGATTLQLIINDSSDTLTVDNYFEADGTSRNVVENIQFADGTVWNVATLKAKVLLPTAGNDWINGYSSNDTLVGNEGSDQLRGYAGDDVLEGGIGADQLDGGEGNDLLKGGEHNDRLGGGWGNDTLDGGAGDDVLSGSLGADVYLFGKGSGLDAVENGDNVPGGLGDSIVLGAGITPSGVTLTQDAWFNLVITLNETSEHLTVMRYFESDGATGNTVGSLKFADGTNWNYAAVKSRLTPAPGISVAGTAAAENIVGGIGADTLSGAAGNDTLTGAGGNDTLDGGLGNDTYVFGKGSGQDRVSSRDSTAGKVDVIQLGAGITPADITLTRVYGASLLLEVKGGADRLLVFEYFAADASAGYQVEQIRFVDGTVWDIAKVKSMVLIATLGNDSLVGYAAAETLAGLAGDDSLSGGGGNDTLDGETGNDQLLGDDGNDVLRGGADADTLEGGAGDDTLDGGAGSDGMRGGLGNDVYLFGKGAGTDGLSDEGGSLDVIQLGAGVTPADVVLSRRGDHLYMSINGTADDLWVFEQFSDGGPSIELIKFADGTSWNAAKIQSLVDAAVNTPPTVAVPLADQTAVQGALLDFTIPTAAFADADIATGDALTYKAYLSDYSLLPDWLSFNPLTRTFTGRAPVDRVGAVSIKVTVRDTAKVEVSDVFDLIIKAEDRSITGTAGNDNLTGWSGNDTLLGGAGDDYLLANNGNDSLDGGAGWDNLTGNAGDDDLSGGAGNDTLIGDAGSDTYRWGLGDGNDVVQDYSAAALVDVDTLQLTGTLTPTDVMATRTANDMVLTIKASGEVLTIKDQFVTSPEFGIDKVVFANGVVWSRSEFKSKVAIPAVNLTAGADSFVGTDGDETVFGLAGADTIDGGLGDDKIDGGAGDDSLMGSGGEDTLDGGAGNDVLDGGNDANDTYLWGLGSGKDTLIESGSRGAETLQLKGSWGVRDLTFTRTGDDLLLRSVSTSDELLIKGQFANGGVGRGIDRLVFGPGSGSVADSVWSRSDLSRKFPGVLPPPTLLTEGNDRQSLTVGNDVVNALGGDDYLMGLGGIDWIAGGSGNDTIWGGSGNDTIEGGAGFDYLAGRGGVNTYLFGWSSQDDLVDATREFTTPFEETWIKLAPDVKVSDLRLVRDGNTLVLQLGNTDAQLRLGGYFSGTDDAGVQTSDVVFKGIEFADGTSWSSVDIASRVIKGGSTVTSVGTVDTVTTTQSYRLLEEQENLTALATGTLNLNLYGNDGNNRIAGNAGSNGLNMARAPINWTAQGADVRTQGDYPITFTHPASSTIVQKGQDTLVGGPGDDQYKTDGYEQRAGGLHDVVVELANEGHDTIITTNIDEALPDNVEDLIAISSVKVFDVYALSGKKIPVAHVYQGNSLNNRIDTREVAGLARLDGGAGADTLFGNVDFDNIYVVDHAGDVVVELGAVGVVGSTADGVESSVNYTLGAGIENLTLTGPYAINGTGNGGVNVLDASQNAAINTLTGLGGDDTYIVGLNDRVVEAAGGGTDTVVVATVPAGWVAPIALSAWAHVENLKLTNDAGNGNLQGDANANVLAGSHGSNVIEGGAGNDSIAGGHPVFEDGSLLDLRADDVLNGGDGDDVITGWSGNSDTLSGGAGNDVLSVRVDSASVVDGGAGNDTIGSLRSPNSTSSGGYKVVTFGKGDGQDTILSSEVSVLTSSLNTLRFKAGVAVSEVSAKRVGDDLEVLIGTGADKVTVQGFFKAPTTVDFNPIQQFQFADGTLWNTDQMAELATGTVKPKVAVPVPDYRFNLGQVFSVTVPSGSFIDPNVGDVLTYSASNYGDSPLASWISFNPSTRTFSGTAPSVELLELVKLTATDKDGNRVSDVFNITVAPNKVLMGTAANNNLEGGAGDDSLSGLGGNDTLGGGFGSDTLDGGAGNDSLYGSVGNDVYLFGKGDGQDTLIDDRTIYPGSENPVNILRFKSGVTSSEVSLSKLGNDLVASIAASTDKVTVTGYFDPANKVKPLQQIEFSNGDKWDIAKIESLVTSGSTNTAPKLVTALADQAAKQGAALSFAVPAGAFADADVGDALTYSATLASGAALPSWLTFNASTRAFTGTAPSTLGTTSIKVVATDKAGLLVSDVFDLVVTAPANTAPKLVTALADQTVALSAALSFTLPAGAFADSDVGDALTYRATSSSGAALPKWLSFNASTRTFTGKAPGTARTVSIKVVATDKAGLAVSDVFRVVVSAAASTAPSLAAPLSSTQAEGLTPAPRLKNHMLPSRQSGDAVPDFTPSQVSTSTSPRQALEVTTAQAAAPVDEMEFGVSKAQAQWAQLTEMMAMMSSQQRAMQSAMASTGTMAPAGGPGMLLASDHGLQASSAARLESQVHQLISAMAAFAPPSASETSLAKPYTAAFQGELAAPWGA